MNVTFAKQANGKYGVFLKGGSEFGQFIVINHFAHPPTELVYNNMAKCLASKEGTELSEKIVIKINDKMVAGYTQRDAVELIEECSMLPELRMELLDPIHTNVVMNDLRAFLSVKFGKETYYAWLQNETRSRLYCYTIPYTTRAKNSKSDIDGVNYHFVGRRRFLELEQEGFFLECIYFDGEFYGIGKPDKHASASGFNLANRKDTLKKLLALPQGHKTQPSCKNSKFSYRKKVECGGVAKKLNKDIYSISDAKGAIKYYNHSNNHLSENIESVFGVNLDSKPKESADKSLLMKRYKNSIDYFNKSERFQIIEYDICTDENCKFGLAISNDLIEVLEEHEKIFKKRVFYIESMVCLGNAYNGRLANIGDVLLKMDHYELTCMENNGVLDLIKSYPPNTKCTFLVARSVDVSQRFAKNDVPEAKECANFKSELERSNRQFYDCLFNNIGFELVYQTVLKDGEKIIFKDELDEKTHNCFKVVEKVRNNSLLGLAKSIIAVETKADEYNKMLVRPGDYLLRVDTVNAIGISEQGLHDLLEEYFKVLGEVKLVFGRKHTCLINHVKQPEEKCAPELKCGIEKKCAPEVKCGIERKCAPEVKCEIERKCAPEVKCEIERKCAPEVKCEIERKCTPEVKCQVEKKCAIQVKCGIEPTCSSEVKCSSERNSINQMHKSLDCIFKNESSDNSKSSSCNYSMACRQVILRKCPEELYGIFVGKDIKNRHCIYEILAGSVADRSHNLKPGDIILKINGIDVARLSHSLVAKIINNSLTCCSFDIQDNDLTCDDKH